ncbi:hypothetical protein WIW50_07255 [Flavobacteriaceae bacterium 3-367]|uniref:hypothetical protein n=1 Tax=Eudoraea algarum TaxID=3417568 RepID=UPI00328DC5E2
MKKLKDTPFYRKALQEINYSFGNYYLFDSFIIAEINEDVLFTWENHGKRVAEDLTNLYDNDGQDYVLITHRINAYSVMPTDWIKFFKNSYKLKGYAIVSYTRAGFLNAGLEKIFLKSKVKRFKSLENAIAWAQEIANSKTLSS